MAKTRNQLTTVFRAVQEQTEILRIALNKLSDKSEIITPGVIRELIKNRPTSITDLEKITAVSEEVTNQFGYEIVKVFTQVKKQFDDLAKNDEEFSDNISWIDYDSRFVIENIALRNIRVAENNPQLNISKNDSVITRKKGELDELATHLFNSRNENLYKRVKTAAADDFKKLFASQEEYKSLWSRSNVYISVGVIKGKILGQQRDLKIEAPLLFLPVEIEEEGDYMNFYWDPSRNIEYNKDLVVSKLNLSKENLVLVENEFANILAREEFVLWEVVKQLKVLMEDNDFRIGEKVTKENLVISPTVSIGQFDVHKNSTHSDIEFMLDNGIVTNNILDMISSKDIEVDDEEEVERLKEINGAKMPYFISKLNYPQNRAVKAVDVYGDIVIQGPPGTGKTEVISSIISNAVMQDKKVLISSEKSVAIEVVKNRLQDLAVYSVLLTDIKDTNTFYKQIEIMVEEAQKSKQNEEVGGMETTEREDQREWNTLKSEIFDYVKQYKEIFDHLNSPRLGKTFSWIYKNHASHRTSEKEIQEILSESTILEVIKSNKMLNKNLHKVLFMLNKKFSFKKNIDEFDIDKAIIHKYPFLITHTKKHITTKKIQKAINKLEDQTDETLIELKSFSKKAISILKPLFKDPEHLFSYLHTKQEIEMVLDVVSIKLNSYEEIKDNENEEIDEKKERARQIYTNIGAAWMITFDQIVDLIESKGKKIDQELISNIIFDYTMMSAVEHIEQSNPKLQENISNGNIDTFNQMISRALSEMIESTLSLSERKLRDTLLEALDKNSGKQQILNFIQTSKHANISKFMERYWDIVFNSINVWMLTPDEVSSFFPLEPNLFDIVVIDEASQMTINKALPLLYRAKQIVISGDDKQLKPSINPVNRIYFDTEESKLEGVQIPPAGLQDALKNKLPNFLLNYHYRSKFAELIAYSNTNIYNKTLYVSTPNTYSPSNPPITLVKAGAARMVKGKNEKEATAVVKQVQKILKDQMDSGEKFDANTIGIIAFTAEQRDVVENKLQAAREKDVLLDKFMTRKENKSRNGEDETLFVKNVSEVQGDERDIIVFSIGFAKQSNGKMPNNFGVISDTNGENRLNVVITRAKQKIIVVNSFEPKEFSNIISDTDIGGKQLLNFIDYATAVSEGDVQSVNTILENKSSSEVKSLESRMHEEVFSLIKSKGYHVEYKYGFDNYKIDFVVRENPESPILIGFNIDNDQYLKHRQTFEREFYLPTYLSARGWNLHRIWSHQWSKDVEEQNDRIITLIQKAIKSKGKQDNVISTFGKGTTVLDFESLQDGELIERGEENKIIEEGTEIIDTRFKDLKELTKQIKSRKNQREEDRWLAEMDAIQNHSRNLNTDVDYLVKKDFNELPVEKLLDGIENDDLDAIIALLDKRINK